ncbi:MAG TPA: DUF2277 domain-containing protein [Candidatus Saccharimonadales bacterium]|nr:DUF2277 domain-containing protein [Candidatus Saccharimonadales bacterium]
MCRSIKSLRSIEPPANSDDIRAAALQYVRKVSGYRAPSKRNQTAFDHAVAAIAASTDELLQALQPAAHPHTHP